MIEIKVIGEEQKADIRLKNEPFPLWGKLVPSLRNGVWDYSVEEWPKEERKELCFPDEDYDFDEMKENYRFVGAYEDGVCVGLAVLKRGFFKYLYVDDLKVNRACRGRGIGRRLLEKADEVAKELGYRGLSLTAQDNNLSACLFYLAAGFRIGGFDTEVYRGTNQAEKADIIFYRDREKKINDAL